MKEITPDDNIIDSREVNKQFKKLTKERNKLSGSDLEKWKDEYEKYCKRLGNLIKQGEFTFGVEWEYGVTLINDDYFKTYAEEFANDIGAIDSKRYDWPINFIDWDGASDSLKSEYIDLEWHDSTFYGRT